MTVFRNVCDRLQRVESTGSPALEAAAQGAGDLCGRKALSTGRSDQTFPSASCSYGN